MCIIQVLYMIRQILLYQFFHLLGKRTGVTNWIAALNARGKNNCVGTSFHKFPRS